MYAVCNQNQLNEVLRMSTHNMFSLRNKKSIHSFGVKKVLDVELCDPSNQGLQFSTALH